MSKKFDLAKFKESIKIADTPLKKDSYVELQPELQAVLGMPGIPLGHVVQIFGKSDTGKTTIMLNAAIACQKQAVLPILILVENKFSWTRADAMGFNRDDSIVNEDCEFLEDIFLFIDKMLAAQGNGDLPRDIVFFVDAIGSAVSSRSVTVNKDGTRELGGAMMLAAKTIRERMRTYMHAINRTRKIASPYFASLVFINHAYTQPPAFPGGPSKLVPYGGEGIWLASSLVLRTQAVQQLNATKDGKKLKFGIVSKIIVDKNHITNTSNSGEFV